jgi:prolyl 4-hydroxylase
LELVMTFVICVVVLGMAAVPQHTYSVSLTPSTPHRCLAPRLGSKVARKAAAAFEEYEISDIGGTSLVFPLPKNRVAIRLHKKFAGKGGVAISKAPPEALPTGLNVEYPGLRMLHLSPLVLSVDNFFTPEECDAYRALKEQPETHKLAQSATFSTMTASARTSTTWFVRYQDAPQLLAKASSLLGVPPTHFEEPQLVHYASGQSFSWHYDAVPPTLLANGGQRLATLLVYLDDVPEGGRTAFRDLQAGGTGADGRPARLEVAPKRGRALLFFPSAHDGAPDERTLHAGEPTGHEKWIAQLWLHERPYKPNVPMGSSHEEASPLIGAFAAAHGLTVVV